MKAKGIAAGFGLVVLCLAIGAFAYPRSQLRGRPQIQIGGELGYFVWMDGAVLHVRWTTTNPDNHGFRGEVVVESGELRSLSRVSLEDSDRTILESPQRLVFNAVEARGLDGFDITLPGAATVKLNIDGRPAEKAMIFMGGRRKNPTADGDVAIGGR
jgi:hypothetical protein